MKTILIWLGAALALGLLNLGIMQKERTLEEGETLYLELAPVDPRSLMQGDYMILRYEIARSIREADLQPLGGRMIVTVDRSGAVQFARLDDGQPLAENERYLAYKNRRGARFGIESFFFQEGRGDHYADARYAEIKLDARGSALLVDLVVSPPQPPQP